jgi:hypothetical protein
VERHVRSGMRWILGLVFLIGSACLLRPSRPGPLIYEGPYRVDLAVGERLPGTDVRYLGVGAQGARVRIEGQEAIRLAGDSLEAEAQPHPALAVRYNLRIYSYDERALHAIGTVHVEIREAQPRMGPLPEKAAVRFTAPVTYRVPRDGVIPGTSIVYRGKEDGRARLEGLPGYPYRNIGDSILWTGQVHPMAHLNATLRVLLIEDSWLTLGGTVEVWLSGL